MSDALNTLSFQIDRTPEFAAEGAVRVDFVINGTPVSDELLNVAGILFGGAADRCSYYLFTCSCGVAGCNDFHQPLDQIRKDDQVIWQIEDEKLARVLGAKTLSFDLEAFDAARQSLLADLKDLETKGLFAESLMDTHYSSQESRMVGIPLAEITARLVPYYHGQTKMHEALDAAGAAEDSQSLRAIWEHDTEFFTFTPSSLAARLLNLGESVFPDDVERVNALGKVAQILRDFFATADEKAAEAAFLPYRSFLDEDGINEPETPYFRTDEDGPYVRLP